MSTGKEGAAVLPIVGTLIAAGVDVWRLRIHLLQALLAPAILLLAFAWLPPLLLPLRYAVYAVFAITCHRIVLLGPESLPNRWGIYFSRRELRYALYALIVVVCLVSAFAVISLLSLLAAPLLGQWAGRELPLIVFAVLIYLFARVCILFPGTAVDQAWSIPACWTVTRGYGIRLTVLVLLSVIVPALGPLALVFTVGAEHPNLVRALSPAFLVIEPFSIAVVSLAFWALCPAHLLPSQGIAEEGELESP